MDNGSSAESSFYDPPEQYDENKTRRLYKNLDTNFGDLKNMLMSVQENVLRSHSDFVVTVKLIEKLKAHEEQAKQNQNKSNNKASNTRGTNMDVDVNEPAHLGDPSETEISTRLKSIKK